MSRKEVGDGLGCEEDEEVGNVIKKLNKSCTSRARRTGHSRQSLDRRLIQLFLRLKAPLFSDGVSLRWR